MSHGSKRATLVVALRPHLAPYRGLLLKITACSVLSAVAEAFTLVILVALAQSIVADGRATTARIVILGDPLAVATPALLMSGLLAVFVRTLLQLVAAALTAQLSSRYEEDRKSALLSGYLSATWETQAIERAGHLQTVFTTDIEIARGTVDALAKTTAAVFGFAVLAVSALLIDPLAAVVVVAAIAAVGAGLRPLSNRARSHALARTQLYSSFANHVTELVVMAREFRVFHVQAAVAARSQALLGAIRTTRKRTEFLSNAMIALYQGAALLLAMVGVAAIYLLNAGDLSAVGAVVLLLIRALSYSTVVQSMYHTVTERMPHFERVSEMTRHYSHALVPASGAVLQDIGSLEFSKVSFEYTRGQPVLNDLSFAIARGETVGIIGASGSGKSTLTQLLLRLRLPSSGKILVNGSDVREYSLSSWYQRIGFVPQEPLLVDGSITDNIRFFREGLSDADVHAAAERAGLGVDLVEFPLGYDTQAGERGNALSGGQRQRICIARALAGQPDLIIFDEPTSALDVHSEEFVQQTLSGLGSEMTVFIIAHRMSTLNICDRIMVLDGGRVTAFAAPDALAIESEYYREALRISGSR